MPLLVPALCRQNSIKPPSINSPFFSCENRHWHRLGCAAACAPRHVLGHVQYRDTFRQQRHIRRCHDRYCHVRVAQVGRKEPGTVPQPRHGRGREKEKGKGEKENQKEGGVRFSDKKGGREGERGRGRRESDSKTSWLVCRLEGCGGFEISRVRVKEIPTCDCPELFAGPVRSARDGSRCGVPLPGAAPLEAHESLAQVRKQVRCAAISLLFVPHSSLSSPLAVPSGLLTLEIGGQDAVGVAELDAFQLPPRKTPPGTLSYLDKTIAYLSRYPAGTWGHSEVVGNAGGV
eukprot:2457174-Rhodomonas_salina.3